MLCLTMYPSKEEKWVFDNTYTLVIGNVSEKINKKNRISNLIFWCDRFKIMATKEDIYNYIFIK